MRNHTHLHILNSLFHLARVIVVHSTKPHVHGVLFASIRQSRFIAMLTPPRPRRRHRRCKFNGAHATRNHRADIA